MVSVSGCKKVTPDTGFSFIVSSSDEGNVIFTNTTSGGERFNWDFGDGSNSTSKHTTHKYSKNGSYLVNMKATSADNVSSTSSQIVKIDNVQGTLVFYTNHNFGEPVDVYVGSVFVGSITKYLGGSAECLQDGCVTVIGPEGAYNYSAKTRSGNVVWNGQFTVKSGICSAMRLKP